MKKKKFHNNSNNNNKNNNNNSNKTKEVVAYGVHYGAVVLQTTKPNHNKKSKNH